jgi:hypothetical protein
MIAASSLSDAGAAQYPPLSCDAYAPGSETEGMSLHVIVLDASRHQAFLKQQRKDPVTKELLKHGDRIVLCAHCAIAFLEESWEVVKGRRFGHGTDTLSDIEIAAEPTHFGRHRPAPPPPIQTRANGNGATAAPPDQDMQAEREPSAEVGPLRLREIPFQLREIPFSLRQISEF